MKIKISSLTLLVLTVFAGLAVQARAQIVNCIVAVVDDQPITRVDVLVALEFGLCDASNATGDPRTAAAWALVDRKLAVRTLRGQWVPGQEETESVLQSLKKEAGAAKFAAGLAAFDLIESDLLPYIREKVAYDKILAARFNRSVLVSRGDIERYYRDVLVPERKSRGMEPEPQASVEKEIVDRLQGEARRKQIGEWLLGLREQVSVKIDLDCLK